MTAVLTAAVLALVALLYRPFLMLSFDRKRAAAVGLPVDALKKTVERNNAFYKKGVDEDFGKEKYRLSACRQVFR